MKVALAIIGIPAAAWALMWIIETLSTREVYGRVMDTRLADKLLVLLNRKMLSDDARVSPTMLSLGGPGYFADVASSLCLGRTQYYFSTQSLNVRVPLDHPLHERICGLLECGTTIEDVVDDAINEAVL